MNLDDDDDDDYFQPNSRSGLKPGDQKCNVDDNNDDVVDVDEVDDQI